MEIGVQIANHVARRAIVTGLRRAKYLVRGLDLTKLRNTDPEIFDAIIIGEIFSPDQVMAILAWIKPESHLIFISSYQSLPSVRRLIPWTENAFDPTLEAVSDATEADYPRLAERLLVLSPPHIKWSIVRPAIVEGPLDPNPQHTRWFVDRILDRGRIILPDEDEQPYRHISTRDLAGAIIAVLGAPTETVGKILHACSDGVLTPSFHAQIVANALGRPVKIEYVPKKLWDKAKIERPMAGSNGWALLDPSPVLAGLGWKPTPPQRFLQTLTKELSDQPRFVNSQSYNAEMSLTDTENHFFSLNTRECTAWRLFSGGESDQPIVFGPGGSPPKTWKTIAVALCQDVQMYATRLNEFNLQLPLVAPMLVERGRGRSRKRKLVCGQFAISSVGEQPDAIDVPLDLDNLALLACPLAKLLASWPQDAPDGEVWVLGRSAEAWLASLMAGEQGRAVRLIGLIPEPAQADCLPPVEGLYESRSSKASIIINLSGGTISDAALVKQLKDDGILVSADGFHQPLGFGRRVRPMVCSPDTSWLHQAVGLLWDLKIVDRHPEVLLPLFANDLSAAFIAAALRLPVLTTKELP